MPQPNAAGASSVMALSVGGAVLGFLSSVLVARMMGPVGFQDYAVALAGLGLLGTIAEMGTGKFALKFIPERVNDQDWGRLRGFLRFSFWLVLGISLVMTLVAEFLEQSHDGRMGDDPAAMALLFLPVVALVPMVAELVMAFRAPVRGSMITRLICPLVTLTAMAVWWSLAGELSVNQGLVCFGGSSVVGLMVGGFWLRRLTPPAARRVRPQYEVWPWLVQCGWYLGFAFLISWVFRISVLVLEFSGTEQLEVARFVAALETASLLLIVAKATNKFYQPELSLILRRQDFEYGLRLKDRRRWLVGSVSALFLLVMVVAGKRILGLFGPEYEPAYPALCLMSVATGLATTFAMAPEFLKFVERLGSILVTAGVTGVALCGLTWWWAPRYGATGAAAAFTICISGMALTYYLLARQHFRSALGGPEGSPDAAKDRG